MHGPIAYPAGETSPARRLGAVTVVSVLHAIAAAAPARAVEFDPPEAVERSVSSDGKETIRTPDVTRLSRRRAGISVCRTWPSTVEPG